MVELAERLLEAGHDMRESPARPFALVPSLRVLHRHHVLLHHREARVASARLVLD